MSVRSESLKDGQRVEQPSRIASAETAALAIALLFFGGLGWIAGGKFTVEGWTDWFNRIGHWIGVEGALTVPRGWVLVALIALSGVAYSLVEIAFRSTTARRQPLFWVAWLPIVATDVGSTYFGVRAAGSADPLILQQVAAAWPLAILVALVLTFLPEWMMIGAWKLLRRLL